MWALAMISRPVVRKPRLAQLISEKSVLDWRGRAAGAVEHANAPERVGKGLARHPIPVMLLARLAVARSEQGSGGWAGRC